jgi:stage II sporulation protein AA (anti-sigma F factor antagonist)
MDFSSTYEAGELTILLSGELDHHAAQSAWRGIASAIDARLPTTCTLNMGGVTFSDSSGIALLLRSQKKMSELGGTLKAVNVNAQPQRIFNAAKIERIVEITAGPSAVTSIG